MSSVTGIWQQRKKDASRTNGRKSSGIRKHAASSKTKMRGSTTRNDYEERISPKRTASSRSGRSSFSQKTVPPKIKSNPIDVERIGKIKEVNSMRNDTDVLMDETRKMEERLMRLRISLKTEKAAIMEMKNKDGHLWMAAKEVPKKYKNYKEMVIEESKKKKIVKKRRKRSSNAKSKANINSSKELEVSQRRQEKSNINSFKEEMVGPDENENQKSNLLEGNYNEFESAVSFKNAREEWLQYQVPEDRNKCRNREAASDEKSVPAPSDLISGTFDEKESSKGFQEAREEWLKSFQKNSSKNTVEVETDQKQISNLLGKEFDEAESSQSFQEARNKWLAQVNTNKTVEKTSSNLLEGEFDESKSANSFKEARLEWLNQTGGNINRTLKPKPEKMESFSNESNSNSKNLLEGDFNESESSNSFKEARLEWLKQMGNDNIDTKSVNRKAVSGSLLDGEFDESQSQKMFQNARENWIQSLKLDTKIPEKEDSWNINVAFGERPSTVLGFLLDDVDDEYQQKEVVITKEVEINENKTQTDVVKQCCYHCYLLFELTDENQGIYNEKVKETFCSEDCSTEYERSNKLRCPKCQKRFNISDGDISGSNSSESSWMCRICIEAHGEELKPNDEVQIRKIKENQNYVVDLGDESSSESDAEGNEESRKEFDEKESSKENIENKKELHHDGTTNSSTNSNVNIPIKTEYVVDLGEETDSD